MASPCEVQPIALKCPVCAADFRDAEICPRCGTNLEHLMHIAARAWTLRQRCRGKLRGGDLHAALQCSAIAWQMQHQGTAFLHPLHPRR